MGGPAPDGTVPIKKIIEGLRIGFAIAGSVEGLVHGQRDGADVREAAEEHVQALDGNGGGSGLEDAEFATSTDQGFDACITDMEVPGDVETSESRGEFGKGGQDMIAPSAAGDVEEAPDVGIEVQDEVGEDILGETLEPLGLWKTIEEEEGWVLKALARTCKGKQRGWGEVGEDVMKGFLGEMESPGDSWGQGWGGDGGGRGRKGRDGGRSIGDGERETEGWGGMVLPHHLPHGWLCGSSCGVIEEGRAFLPAGPEEEGDGGEEGEETGMEEVVEEEEEEEEEEKDWREWRGKAHTPAHTSEGHTWWEEEEEEGYRNTYTRE
ncbi:hypothetical protein BJ684DRAFT_14533 [Piptocephalis cylindrospora]|uniref:Uncharacterized protein n=1 Tax=Piptocephalis cylindrospora TaxID=1907219 RepID=A0A4P9YAR2_9FUNG|nr:hypothetical protein BJ684DRAFT_14533 [Piptocephalis cylindrospora]|eukprot:RKP15190.1 hypothetical protein BJ684DRAFT_14533 [Piptocephalis cylindrospora]